MTTTQRTVNQQLEKIRNDINHDTYYLSRGDQQQIDTQLTILKDFINGIYENRQSEYERNCN